ncbi:Neurexin-3 [Labeo rohita]|uniref:Neurexin-3 n=1 Tax=Labeo rohita TaxID=84645 RepID=A0ABQ8LRK1_LABRO|nr:Neurexin-3 [Labeo rohita]
MVIKMFAFGSSSGPALLQKRFIWLKLVLLLSFVSGSTTVSVTGKKGGSVTLPCEIEAKEIFRISLNSWSKTIPVCQTEECSGRVFKQGSCDIVIKDLIFTDAGKYILRVFYHNDQPEQKQKIREYQLHIHDEIAVKTGEELKLDVLLPNADKVQHQSTRGTEWVEDWGTTDGVQNKRMTISDGNLIISAFTANDAGTYRILDSEGNILITVTVTESSTESKKKTDSTDKDKTGDMEYQVPVMYWIMSTGLLVYVFLLVLTLVTLTIRKNTPVKTSVI